ncbi:MAG: hypothetical protein ACRD9R_19845 [Pyrinomonadaceae bacterium]
MLFNALFFTGFFGWVLFSDRFLIGGDAFVYSYPLRTVAWQMIREGHLPLWTPLLFSGYPVLSMAQVAVGYPLTWVYLILPGYYAEQIFVLAPFLLLPAFTYAYARTISLSRTASLLAGLTCGYGGMMTSASGAIGYLPNAFMWLPLVLIPIERARTKSFAGCLCWATLADAMSVLVGYGFGLLLVGTISVGYGAFVSAITSDLKQRRINWRPLGVAVGGLALSLGLAAFQILETMRAVRRSVRSSLDYETFSEGSFSPLEAFNSFLAPLDHYWDVSTYVAPLAFALAVLACVRAARDPRRDPRILFWLVLAVVASVLMLGANTPLYRLVYRIPLFNLFRVPARHCFEWMFAISILSAYGWDALGVAASRVWGARQKVQWQNIVIIFGSGSHEGESKTTIITMNE